MFSGEHISHTNSFGSEYPSEFKLPAWQKRVFTYMSHTDGWPKHLVLPLSNEKVLYIFVYNLPNSMQRYGFMEFFEECGCSVTHDEWGNTMLIAVAESASDLPQEPADIHLAARDLCGFSQDIGQENVTATYNCSFDELAYEVRYESDDMSNLKLGNKRMILALLMLKRDAFPFKLKVTDAEFNGLVSQIAFDGVKLEKSDYDRLNLLIDVVAEEYIEFDWGDACGLDLDKMMEDYSDVGYSDIDSFMGIVETINPQCSLYVQATAACILLATPFVYDCLRNGNYQAVNQLLKSLKV